MTLSDFIRNNVDTLLDDWDAFAESIDLSGRNLTLKELRNDARKILKAIADDIEKVQTDNEQEAKSKGDRPHHAPVITKYARTHAMDRLSHGFDLDEMVSEYRALRANVVRQWTAKLKRADRSTLDELVRFNEAVDQGTTESIRQYSFGLERARGISLGVLAHDLRTPLSAISSSAEAILCKRRPSADEVTKTAQWIRNSSVRMQRIVDDLVDFTRTRLGAVLPLNRRDADLGEACRQTVQELGARDADRRIQVDCSGDLTGHWDPVRLEQLVSNLLSNALRYGPPSSPVTLLAEGKADEVTLSVHNEGEPIPKDVQRTMFHPLVRHAANTDHAAGLGLGLYIVRIIVDAHRGRIEVDSGAHGTKFNVTLPRNAEDSLSGNRRT